METTVKKGKKKAAPKGVAIFKKMLEDKKAISKHLKSGGFLPRRVSNQNHSKAKSRPAAF